MIFCTGVKKTYIKPWIDATLFTQNQPAAFAGDIQFACKRLSGYLSLSRSSSTGQLSELKTTEIITTRRERKIYLLELESVQADIDRIERKCSLLPATS